MYNLRDRGLAKASCQYRAFHHHNLCIHYRLPDACQENTRVTLLVRIEQEDAESLRVLALSSKSEHHSRPRSLPDIFRERAQ